MERTSTQPFKGLLRSLLLQCFLVFGIISIGYGQAATLPLAYGGAWQNSLPTGWSGKLGPDFTINLGNSIAGGSAGFDEGKNGNLVEDGHYLIINFDKAPGTLSYWLGYDFALSFSGNEFKILESADGITYTVINTHTNIPFYESAVKYSVNPSANARYIKFHYTVNQNGASVLLDDVTLTEATAGPEINIKQSGTSINSGGSFSFGTVGINSTNLKSFTVENSGTEALQLTGNPKITITGTDASQFTVNESATQATVAAGDFTSFDVTFKPTSFGNKTATLSIANNDANENPYTITLAGSAQELDPTISGLSPSSGNIGITVAITGTNLGAVSSVTFNGVTAQFTIVSDTQIDAVVPQNATTGPIKVTTSGGKSAESGTFTVTSPYITALTPNAGTVYDIITITGENLNAGNRPSVRFTGASGTKVSAKIVTKTNTEVKVEVPLNAVTGPIELINSNGTAISNTFTVTGPTITSLSPTSGKVGHLIKITGTGFDASSSVSFNGVAVPAGDIVFTNNTEITAKVPAGATTGPITVTTVGRSGQSQTFTVLVQTITVTGTLAEFRTKVGTPSSSQSYEISGSNLDDNITVAAPSNFQVSVNNIDFAGSLTITAVNGSVSARPLYVRYNPAMSGVHSGSVSNSSTNATTRTIAVSGNSEPAAIAVTGSLSKFTATVGTPSVSQSYTVSGTNLDGGIAVTAPAGFEVSLNNTSFAPEVTVALAAGSTSIASTTVYARYNPAAAGTHSGNIMHASQGATTQTLAVQGEATVPQETLPVELVSFTYVQQQDGTLLEWKTASEKDNSHFEIEMSNDPRNGFKTIGKINSKVINSSSLTKYQYKHSYLGTGNTRYYRLKQVDLDGTFEYSNVIAVEATAVQVVEKVTVAPNPVNYNAKVFVSSLTEGKAVLRLTSLEGKLVYTKEVAVHKGENEIQLPVYDLLSKGVYILTVELNGAVHNVKVFKQ